MRNSKGFWLMLFKVKVRTGDLISGTNRPLPVTFGMTLLSACLPAEQLLLPPPTRHYVTLIPARRGMESNPLNRFCPKGRALLRISPEKIRGLPVHK